jgi:phosphate transport system substrate-binding protein
LHPRLAFAITLLVVAAGCSPAATEAPPEGSPPSAAAPTEGAAEPMATEPMATEPMAAGELPDFDPADYSGTVTTAGSSTVFPLAEAVAFDFQDEGFDGEVTIASIGSGAGLERFCAQGETDVANSSRAIKDEEVELCRAIGREPIEFRVGTDGLAVVVSAENDFADDLTMEELATAFSTAETWADIRPEWPAEPIERFSPGTDSGTFDYFVEAVFEEDPEPLLAASPQMSEDDNVLVQGVLGSPYAIGYFGYAYYVENEGSLKILAIDGVAASQEAVDDATYPLARPLFIYSDATILTDKPHVAAYVAYFLAHVNDVIGEVGYFPANEADMQAARQNWLDAVGPSFGSG